MNSNEKPVKKVFFDEDTEKKISFKANRSDKDVAKIKDGRITAERFPTANETKAKDDEAENKAKNDKNSLTNEEKAKLLTDFFKMAYYLDEGVLKHKVQEDKVKKIEKKQDSDDEERLVYVLRDLEKDIVLPNRIYYMNNEDLKYNTRLRSKKQNMNKAPPVTAIELKPILPEQTNEEDTYRKQKDIDEFYDIEDDNKLEKKECMII